MSGESTWGTIRFRLPQMSLTERAVWSVLAAFAHSETGECFPAVSTIAEELGCSPLTVKRALKSLTERGILERVERARPDGSQASSITRSRWLTKPKPSEEQLPGGGITDDTGGVSQVIPLEKRSEKTTPLTSPQSVVTFAADAKNAPAGQTPLFGDDQIDPPPETRTQRDKRIAHTITRDHWAELTRPPTDPKAFVKVMGVVRKAVANGWSRVEISRALHALARRGKPTPTAAQLDSQLWAAAARRGDDLTDASKLPATITSRYDEPDDDGDELSEEELSRLISGDWGPGAPA